MFKSIESDELDALIQISNIINTHLNLDDVLESVMSVTWVDDRLVSSDFGGDVRVWQPGTGARGATFRGHGGSGIFAIAISPNGQHLATGGENGTLRLWDAATGRPLARRRAHDDSVDYHAIDFSPDGSLIATGG